MYCKKCGNPSTIILRKKDNYCNSCFVTNINHKFRACIGKNKILSANENVLVCLSGGPGSMVLLNLIHNGISLGSHKKLRITPYFLHLMGTRNYTNYSGLTNEIINQCNKLNFSVHIVHASEYIKTDKKLLSAVNSIPPVDKDIADKFQTMLNSMSPTAYNDFILKIKRDLFIQYANLLQCKFVFTAETTSTLAINLLSNLAIGRGSQIENDIGFMDSRNEHIKILKPLKDVSKEELDYYIKVMQLVPAYEDNIQENSLQLVISKFVSELQENFPATISTICKTADKIGVHDAKLKTEKCKLCESDLGQMETRLSALEATNFSRTVSLKNPQLVQNTGNDIEEILKDKQSKNDAIFPFIQKQLCYGCSRSYTETNYKQLPNYLIFFTETVKQ